MGRIRVRLVVAFLVVALLPAIPVGLLVPRLLERSFSSPLEAEVGAALNAAIEDSRDRLSDEKERFAREIAAAGDALPAGWTIVADGEIPVAAPAGIDVPASYATELRRGAAGGAPVRVGDWLVAAVGNRVLARPLPEGMVARAEQLVETVGLRRAFDEDRDALLRGYVGPFLLSYALLLIVAAAVAGWLAARIARPVEALSAAADRVAGGDLETRVTASSAGELGRLEESFNRMVGGLAEQRNELARLERVAAWRDLARKLAHEIKNPLTPIQLAVQQLGDRWPREGAPDAEYGPLLAECVDIVNEEVEALRRLVKEFSEFARLPEPQLARADLAATLDDLARLYGSERLAWERPPGDWHARFDEAELRRALINLVDNGLAACRAAGGEERVEFAMERAAGAIVTRVRDAGTGIPPENLKRIFEPNFSTKKDGMGLGLAIVEGIVRGHGGTIGVESESGAGTEFTIRLPAGAEAETGEDR